jgi:predicted dehydrogenase
MSASRVEGFTAQLRDNYGVRIADTIEEVADSCDAILLESVDGRVHLQQFSAIAPFRKPVFIDKPLTVNAQEAEQIARLAEQHGVTWMSSSALRFAEGLMEAIADGEAGEIIGADCYGPMAIQQTQPGLFWYGIHSVEMLYAVLGAGCVEVTASVTADHDVISAVWEDGRIGTVRGNRKGNGKFGGIVHRQKGSNFVDIYKHKKPYYASLLEQIIAMFQSGTPAVKTAETLEIIRFIEAANESREHGKTVRL